MKLYDCKRGDAVIITTQEDGGEVKVPVAHREVKIDETLTFFRLDGMYSYCKDKDGETIHIAGWTDVKFIINVNDYLNDDCDD